MEVAVVEEREFAGEAASVAEARRFVTASVDVEPSVAAVLELAVSEVATNALLHARSAFRLRVSQDSVVRVEVFDRSPTKPVRKDYGPSAPTGRGLAIVEQLTRRWGVTEDRGGKWVWFEVALDDAG